jgi:hypothetical protein
VIVSGLDVSKVISVPTGVGGRVSVGVIVGVSVRAGGGVPVRVGSTITVGGIWVSVGGGIVTISVGLAHAARMATKNKIHNIRRTGFRIMFPPFDLGIPQIIHLKYYSTLLD